MQLADDLDAVLARRGLDGQWRFDYSRNPGITDDLAQRSAARALRPDYTIIGPSGFHGGTLDGRWKDELVREIVRARSE